MPPRLQDGYDHTRWAKIADEVGIGHTALYHYFQSKAHCLLTIMSLELGRSLEAFRGVPAEVQRADRALEEAIAARQRARGLVRDIESEWTTLVERGMASGCSRSGTRTRWRACCSRWS